MRIEMKDTGQIREESEMMGQHMIDRDTALRVEDEAEKDTRFLVRP